MNINFKDLFKNTNFQRILIIIFSFILVLLIFISPIYFYFDSRIYDLMMKYIKKPIKEDDSLILVDIDDNALNYVPYSWPWPRSIHGDAVEVLADFGAKACVYDIEFLSKSAVSINIDEVNNTKVYIQKNFQSMLDEFVNTTDLIAKNPYMQNDLSAVWNSYSANITAYYEDIIKKIDYIIEDNDEYFGKRLKYYGKAFGTVNMISGENEDLSNEDKKNGLDNLMKYGYSSKTLLKNKKSHPAILKVNISEFPVKSILDSFVNIGFTKVFREKDGAIRGIGLFMEKDGFLIPQLAVRPFLDLYNIKPEQIDLSDNSFVVFRNVNINNKIINLKIPVSNDGLMKINWPKGYANGGFEGIFIFNKDEVKNKKEKPSHFSYATLLGYKGILNIFYNDLLNLAEINDAEIKNLAEEYINFMDQKREFVENNILTDEIRKEFNGFLEDYLIRIKNFCSDKTENGKLTKIQNEIDSQIKKNKLKNLDVNELEGYKENIITIFEEIAKTAEKIIDTRKEIKKLEGKICFIGLTGTATTDIGATPMDKDFKNVGTHPSIFNMFIQNSFMYSIPEWIILIFTVLLLGIVVWILIKREASISAPIGFFSTFILLIFILFFYRLTNIYISPVIPLFYGSFSFAFMIILKFVLTEREKSFIRNAFNKYLSPEYINEIIKDKNKLELGGERASCTAIFTDIEGFSSISEKFMDDPKGLVNLLKDYLSSMSDIILENKGTIDKYEGDAIIAFFGKPIEMEDHAFRACLSSIRMKEIEKNLNKTVMDKQLLDKPLLTRIGINTGDMFVGNMGTNNKFNYTIMGHAVNLAARLEGVNKIYATYQMISEYTYQQIKNKIVTRMLDKVRVVNIKTPIRLYELINLREETPKEVLESIDIFHRALNEYENRNWKEALKIFKESKNEKINEGPINIYIDRCKKFSKTPPPEDWDGIYNMSIK